MNIRERIKAELDRQGLSIWELHKRLDGAVSRNTLYRYFRGEMGLSDGTIGVILDALGLKITGGRRKRGRKK